MMLYRHIATAVLALALLFSPIRADLERLLAPLAQPQTAQPETPRQPRATPVADTARAPAQAPQVISGVQLLMELHSLVRSHYNLEGELRLMPIRRLQDWTLPAGGYLLEIVSAPPRLTPSLSLRLRLTPSEGAPRDWILALRVEHWVEAWVSPQRLPSAQSLERADLTTERVNAFLHPFPLVPAHEDLSTFETRRALRAAQPLYWRDLKPRPLVRKGQRVEAFAQEGALLITLPALALEEGHKGDFIRVRNLNSRRELQAQVTHEQRVRVLF